MRKPNKNTHTKTSRNGTSGGEGGRGHTKVCPLECFGIVFETLENLVKS